MEKTRERTRETTRNRNSKQTVKRHSGARIKRRPGLTRVQPLDLATYEPNDLRDRVFRALSELAADDGAAARDHILDALRQGGVDLANCLLLLGIIARSPEEMTPLEVAKLVRYVRINSPLALSLLGDEIVRLIERREPATPPGRHLHKAA